MLATLIARMGAEGSKRRWGMEVGGFIEDFRLKIFDSRNEKWGRKA
tara:strand:+ start:963 stop:1100 length:138 start_codon:yes stop_codon:yes gene_type:complete